MTVYPNGLKSSPRVTSPYGWRVHPITHVRAFHSGTDSVRHPGGWNRAPEAGTVIFAQYNGGAGNEVRIRTAFGVVWRIKHHARIDVAFGQVVEEGHVTGPTGTTGASTGVHCHTECWPAGSTVDPWPYIAARLSQAAGGGGTPIIIPTEDDMAGPFLLYNPSSQHPDRRGWWAPGAPIDPLTTDQAVVASALMKQLKRVSSLTADADVTTQVTDTMWVFIEWLEKNGPAPEILDVAAFAAEVAAILGPQLSVPLDVDEAALAAALAPLLDTIDLDEGTKAALAAAAGVAARDAIAAALSNG